jgi:hypothetical protein
MANGRWQQMNEDENENEDEDEMKRRGRVGNVES